MSADVLPTSRTMLDFEQRRCELMHGPTRLQRLRRMEAKLGRAGMYAKRDDEMGVAIGGNKLRSLEFWLGEAQAQSADVVLVAGGPMSNQCRLTAAAAAMLGLECIVCHNAEESAISMRDSYLNRLFGAQVRFLGRMEESEREKYVENLAHDLRAQGRRPYIIGGAVVGALGYALAAQELFQQSQAQNANVRHVYLPGSMGPTEAGFIFGNAAIGYPFEVHLVSVEYGQAELAARVERILRDLSAMTGIDISVRAASDVQYHMDYLGPGYARPTARSEATILDLARTEGILLEHIYTSKTFSAFIDMARARALPEHEGMCAIHTGGVPSLFSQMGWFETL